MRIVELADLPDRLGPQVGALNWLDGDPPYDARFLRHLSTLGYPFLDYQALFAVEKGQLLGKADTTVHDYVTPAGTESVIWVSGVATRPDALRRGVARALLEEIHSREENTGRRWAFLWTHRSWGAHHLYEELGYKDVYSPPVALRRWRRASPRSLPRGYGWRALRPHEDSLLEELLDVASEGRYGFIPRYRGSFRVRFQFGWRQPSDFRVLTKESNPVGYAHGGSGPYARTASEIVVTHPAHGTAMLDALEREATGRWLALARTTFITDHAGLLRTRGYATYRHSHPTIMAKPLKPNSRHPPSTDPARVCRSPRFSFHGGDVF